MTKIGGSESRSRLLALADGSLALVSAGGLSVAGFGLVGFATTRWPGHALLSVVALGLTLGAWYGARRAAAEVRIGITLALFSTVAMLYAAEIGAILLSQASARRQLTGPDVDTRPMQEVVSDMRLRGEQAEPLVAPFEFVNNGGHEDFGFLPLGGVSSAETVFCNETGPWLTYVSDEYGFNNPPGLWSEPGVLVTGDSFAHGMCVDREASIAGQLRQTWPRTLTIAFGGNGPLLELAALREYGSLLQPATVVWVHYSGNDLDNLYVEGANPDLLRYLDPGYRQNLPEKQQAVDSALRGWIEDQYKTGGQSRANGPVLGIGELVRFLKMSSLRSLLGLTRRTPYDMDLYQNILEAADEQVATWGGQVVFAFLPSYNQLAGAKRTRGSPAEVIRTAEGLGWPVIDARTLFGTDQSDVLRYFAGDRKSPGHYSPLAYRLIAEALRDTIQATHAPQVSLSTGNGPAE